MKLNRIFLLVTSLLIAAASFSQNIQLPKTSPNPNSKGFYEVGYIKPDSGILFQSRDTNWRPKYMALVTWQHAGVDTASWFFDGFKWRRLNSNIGIIPPALNALSPIYIDITNKIGLDTASNPSGAMTKGRYFKSTDSLIKKITASAPISYVNKNISIDTASNPSGAVTKGRLYKGFDSLRRAILLAIDTTTNPTGLATLWRVYNIIDSAFSNASFGFYATEGLIGILGSSGNPDTLIVANAGITTQKIADGAVVTQNISNLQVTNAKLGNASVDNSKLASDVKVGSLAALHTTDKTSIVNAINELHDGVSGGGATTREEYLGSGSVSASSSGTISWASYVNDAIYRSYKVEIYSLKSSVNTDNFKISTISDDVGSSVTTGDQWVSGTGGGNTYNGTGNPFILFSDLTNSASDDGASGWIEIPRNSNLKRPKVIFDIRGRSGGGNGVIVSNGLAWYGATASSASGGVSWVSNGGNLTFGYKIYGVR